MRDTFKVAGWEIKKNFHSKTFIFMTFIFPVLMLGLGAGAGLLSDISSGGTEEVIGVIDDTGKIFASLEENFRREGYTLERVKQTDRDYAEIAGEHDYSGILQVPEDVFAGKEIYFYSEDSTPASLKEPLSRIVSRIRLEEAGFNSDRIFKMTEEVPIVNRPLTEEGGGLVEALLPFFLAVLIAIASIFSGSNLLESIIAEKNNRIVEMLFSSLSAADLMYGKILGYGVMGLAQIGIWGGAGMLGLYLFFDYSPLVFLQVKYLYMLLYFLLGYMMIAALNATVGAASSGDTTGSNSLSSVLAIIPVIPLWLSGLLFSHPDGLLSRILSYIPVFTPVTMILRLGIEMPGISEIVLTFAVLLLFDILLLVLAKKVFRTGMLMYGKKATPGNILQTLRN